MDDPPVEKSVTAVDAVSGRVAAAVFTTAPVVSVLATAVLSAPVKVKSGVAESTVDITVLSGTSDTVRGSTASVEDIGRMVGTVERNKLLLVSSPEVDVTATLVSVARGEVPSEVTALVESAGARVVMSSPLVVLDD